MLVRWIFHATMPRTSRAAIDPAAVKRVALSFERGRPLGSDPWTLKMAGRMGLQYTLNPRGRPKTQEGDKSNDGCHLNSFPNKTMDVTLTASLKTKLTGG